ncbi:MAG: FAD-dependent oxidoreductase [Acidobacteriia bacterium]|nr:FAD-dependent oxidoreductase [Terriglobia bacterium]
MPRVIVAGGGLAGMAAAAALGQSGFDVDLIESRPFLGGRATSYPLVGDEVVGDEGPEVIDNCQHILLRCCVNLLDLYRRLGVSHQVTFHREFFFIEPGGRVSTFQAGPLPAPLHFTGSFLSMGCLPLADKFGIARALSAIRRERHRKDLDTITMLDWLRQHRQTPIAIERFWRQILVSAINEELDRMAASHGIQVFWLGFLSSSDAYEMGVPAIPLGCLYDAAAWSNLPNVRVHLRTPVALIEATTVEAGSRQWSADAVICALPFERVPAIIPSLNLDLRGWDHSPITGIHLWFDRPVTDLPHGTFLDRTIQWFFNKSEGRYIQLVVSASRSLLETPRQEVIDLACRELAEFLPAVKGATLLKAHVVKEVRATFSATPGLERRRPPQTTAIPNLFLAGDWTRSGWPATMEGAVRSGYLAAEAAAAALGAPARFLLPDIA